MGSPSEPAVPAYRTPRLPGRYRQVLGAALNCSEPRCCGAPPHSGPRLGHSAVPAQCPGTVEVRDAQLTHWPNKVFRGYPVKYYKLAVKCGAFCPFCGALICANICGG